MEGQPVLRRVQCGGGEVGGPAGEAGGGREGLGGMDRCCCARTGGELGSHRLRREMGSTASLVRVHWTNFLR